MTFTMLYEHSLSPSCSWLMNRFCQHNVIFLVVPAKFHSVALLGQHKTIRRLNLGNGVLAQRQGHGDFALGAIMADSEEIVGGLCAGGLNLAASSTCPSAPAVVTVATKSPDLYQ